MIKRFIKLYVFVQFQLYAFTLNLVLASLEISIVDEDDNLPTFTTSGSFEASIKEGSAIGSVVQGIDLFVEDLDKVFITIKILSVSKKVLSIYICYV